MKCVQLNAASLGIAWCLASNQSSPPSWRRPWQWVGLKGCAAPSCVRTLQLCPWVSKEKLWAVRGRGWWRPRLSSSWSWGGKSASFDVTGCLSKLINPLFLIFNMISMIHIFLIKIWTFWSIRNQFTGTPNFAKWILKRRGVHLRWSLRNGYVCPSGSGGGFLSLLSSAWTADSYF